MKNEITELTVHGAILYLHTYTHTHIHTHTHTHILSIHNNTHICTIPKSKKNSKKISKEDRIIKQG